MLDLAKLVIKKTNSRSMIIFKEMATDDPKRRCPDISLAKKELDWEPKISLDKGLEKTIEYFRNIDRPDKKILVFAVTYWPDLGPAEKAIYELSKEMPETEFYIITTKFKKDVIPYEKLDNNLIYRVGIGSSLDKYLLPILGVIKAHKLHKEHGYRFAWSVMASYGGLSALLLKLLNRDINFLITLDESEVTNRSFIKSKIIFPIYKIIFKNADSVYLSDVSLERRAKIGENGIDINIIDNNRKNFVNHVRYNYAKLLNKQEKKLERPK
jgi:hypothetical protein